MRRVILMSSGDRIGGHPSRQIRRVVPSRTSFSSAQSIVSIAYNVIRGTPIATLKGKLDKELRILVSVEGEFLPGDADRVDELVESVRANGPQRETSLPVVVCLNSPGGDFIEGLRIGRLCWRNGYGTLVSRHASCYSAAAFAFLGGSYLGKTGGWGADRNLEIGGKVGFHGFYHPSCHSVELRKGVEEGKRLSKLLTEYAAELHIDLGFIHRVLEKRPDQLLELRSVDDLRTLKIAVHGVPRVSVLTKDGAVNAANYATNWQRPVSLRPSAGETLARVELLSMPDYRRVVLSRLIQDGTNAGPIFDLLRRATIGGDPMIDAVIRDLSRLQVLPEIWGSESDTIFHVAGFDIGGGFYVTDCFVRGSVNEAFDLSINVVSVNTANYFRSQHYSRRGDVLYEVRRPDEDLWKQ